MEQKSLFEHLNFKYMQYEISPFPHPSIRKERFVLKKIFRKKSEVFQHLKDLLRHSLPDIHFIREGVRSKMEL
jgi:hypothetical protein